MSKANKTKIPFEAAMLELNEIVEALEKGDITLEASLEKFERGVALTRTCQQLLQDAEQKVEILLKTSDSEAALQPFQDKDTL